MKKYRFEGLLQNESWLMPAYVHIDTKGKTTYLSDKPQRDASYSDIKGYAVPGIPNAHSHAFQYAMAGLAEYHTMEHRASDFWSWRDAMYRLALTMGPDEMEAIAAIAYAEMLRHGYTHVAEFHYVHHDKDGRPYANVSELSERLIRAASLAGIKIHLIPIFYQKGGFGQDAQNEQRRFLTRDIEDYLNLWGACHTSVSHYPEASIGYGVHSLRAVEPMSISHLYAELEEGMSFHMHVSEQKREVEEAIEYLGSRPIEWLNEYMELDQDCHLVHCTHILKREVSILAKAKANVILCPTTEGNLADGFFPLSLLQNAGGAWSIGSDSHIGLNPMEELRLLDYGQRLKTHSRDTYLNNNHGDSGAFALGQMVLNGRRSMCIHDEHFFGLDQSFDALVIDATAPLLDECAPRHLTSTIVYASDVGMYLGTMVNGQWVVKNGKHRKSKMLKEEFRKTIRSLKYR